MKMMIEKHKWAILSASLLFFLVYLYYAVANPLIPRNGDDWRYFGSFMCQPLPLPRQWAITLIFQQYLMPTAGYLSAFLIYPMVGDYLTAASITLALVTAVFVTALFIALYGLLSALCKEKPIATMASVLFAVLCFAFFKDNPTGNVHLFSASQYNLYFCYVFPNILNSLVVLVLMRCLAVQKDLAPRPSEWRSGWLLVGIYFCLFSVLFSTGILLAFALSVLVCRFFALKGKFLQRLKMLGSESVKHYRMMLIIIAGTAIAMFLDATSTRIADPSRDVYTGAIFGGGFIKRIGEAVYQFFWNVRSINKYVFVIMLLVFIVAGVLYFKDKKSRSNPIFDLVAKCLIAGVLQFLFVVLLAAKAGPKYLAEIRCAYGVFFYVILCLSLLTIYILQEIKQSRLAFPFVLVLLTMVMLNSSWPYQKFAAGDRTALVRQFIPALVEADSLGYTEIELYMPKVSPESWEIDCLAEMLYNHNLTLNKLDIEVKYSSDGSVYFAPLGGGYDSDY